MPDKLDLNEFIITRKRKKYRFAKFFNSPICFEFSDWVKRQVDVVEVGAGNGLFSVELAARHPNKTFVAVDVKADRLQRGAYVAAERGLTNIYFVRARGDQINELFGAKSIEQIWVTFPDPYPKKRSIARRLTHPSYLAKYGELLGKHGALYIKHDSREFFNWSLEQLVEQKWVISELSFDLHDSDLNEEYKILTTYEQRWIGEGEIINFVKANQPLIT